MSLFLAKAQRFIVRPAPGWIDLTLSETQQILSNPVQSYKYTAKVANEEGVVVVSDCDYRQALELVTRLTTAHDIDWVLDSGRVVSKGDWTKFFEKSGLADVFSPEMMMQVKLSD